MSGPKIGESCAEFRERVADEVPDVMDWGKDVLKALKAIVAEQNADDAYPDATKTQALAAQFHEWLWDLDDDYVHEPASKFVPSAEQSP